MATEDDLRELRDVLSFMVDGAVIYAVSVPEQPWNIWAYLVKKIGDVEKPLRGVLPVRMFEAFHRWNIIEPEGRPDYWKITKFGKRVFASKM